MSNTPTRIVRVAVPVPLHRLFDYSVPETSALPPVGARVTVPFRGRTLVGVVMVRNPEDAHQDVKPLNTVLDEENILGSELFALGRWLASYYQHPVGEVMTSLLPAAARKAASLAIKRPEIWAICGNPASLSRAPRQKALFEAIEALGGRASLDQIREAGFNRTHLKALAARGLLVRDTSSAPVREAGAAPRSGSTPPELNEEQRTALEALTSARGYAPTLLDGITGSGKTEVYLRHIARVLEAGHQVLVLVPEIALTPQTLARFRARFDDALAMHSNMADSARLQAWLKARSGEAAIVIGTRSAVLTPFADLGLIVVDEEHDASFKQTDGLRYSARDVAVKRARDLDIPLILGSATPSLESLQNTYSGRYRHLKLTRRAGGASLPTFRLLDIRGQHLEGGLAEDLLAAVGRALDAGGQVLVFLNRRGFAPSLICAHCRWQGRCRGCDWPLTMHRKPPGLICHHCGARATLPSRCPECEREALIPVGTGTQRCESVLAERYPDVPIYRIDRDTTRSHRRLEQQLAAINDGQPGILVGTQMLAKGHHFPDVSLVAVVNADGGFVSPDFRAPERTAQLIIQVAGRAGRASRPGEVFVQTYQPDNPLLTTLLEEGYGQFAVRELTARRDAGLPPFQPMAMVRAESVQGDDARAWLARLSGELGESATAYGPAPAMMPRVADRIRHQLMITAASRGALHRALAPLRSLEPPPRSIRWSLDIDPYDTF